MTHKHDSGPAFPLPVSDQECHGRFESGYGGMSPGLVCGKAIQGLLAAQIHGFNDRVLPTGRLQAWPTKWPTPCSRRGRKHEHRTGTSRFLSRGPPTNGREPTFRRIRITAELSFPNAISTQSYKPPGKPIKRTSRPAIAGSGGCREVPLAEKAMREIKGGLVVCKG